MLFCKHVIVVDRGLDEPLNESHESRNQVEGLLTCEKCRTQYERWEDIPDVETDELGYTEAEAAAVSMRRCSCGSVHFVADLKIAETLVSDDDGSPVYQNRDAMEPDVDDIQGPVICAECDRDFDKWQDIPLVSRREWWTAYAAVLERGKKRIFLVTSN